MIPIHDFLSNRKVTGTDNNYTFVKKCTEKQFSSLSIELTGAVVPVALALQMSERGL
jgi:hypothetical protein